MNYILFPLVAVMAIPMLYAQQDITLPGVVVEQNSQYRTGSVIYLSNATIKSAGAAPQRSDAQGKFTLLFADRPGGDVARIFADKSGYEVVNEEEMKQASVIGRRLPLKIVMCPAGQLYDNQIAYYRIARDASIAAYERKVATLNKAGREQERLIAELRVHFNQEVKTKEEALALLETQRQEIEKQAKELADKWVTVNLDDESPAYQRAFAAFEAKNIELAKAILDSVDLEKRLALNSSEKAKEKALVATLEKNIARREEEIRQDVNMCLFKARLHKLGYEWADAERFYDLALAYDEGNIYVTFEVAHFMQSQNQFSKARRYYEKALAQTGQLGQKSTVLNNLGNLLSDTNEMFGAKQAYEEALEIRRKLAEKNPDVYLPDVAMTLNNFGVLLKASNEMVGAKQAYEEALEIFRKFAEKNQDVYLPDMASTLNNLGALFYANNEMVGAKQAFEEALEIKRKLAEINPDVYLADVATTLNNLGVLLSDNDEMVGAKQAFEEALEIYRKLAEKNLDVYLPDVASTLNNLGALFYTNNELDRAKQACEEALEIKRKLAEINPDVYLPHVAATLNNLGGLLKDNNEMVGAKQACEEALKIYRELAEKNPDVYLPDVAKTLNNLGALFYANNEMVGAKQAFEEALELYRKFAKINLDGYLPDVAKTLNNLGILLSDYNEMVGAKQAYDEALEIYRKLAEKNPPVYNLDVAMTDINIGLFYEQLLKITGDMSLKSVGLEVMQDAEKRLTIFPDAHPLVQQYRPYINSLTQFFSDFDEAAFQLQKQIERLRTLETANETEKDSHKKVQRQQEIVSVLSEIEKTMPGNKVVVNQIAKQYGSLAWYQLFVRQFAAAEQSARVGLAKDPGEEWINTNFALALLYQGKWKAAKQVYETLKDQPYGDDTYRTTFLEDLDALEKEGITHPHVAKARSLLGQK